jgi:tetratricopeptide (TPR) repeat protein
MKKETKEVKAYKQAIRIKPDYAMAYDWLGAAYNGLGHYSEAVEAFKQAIRIKPDYAEAHLRLGDAYRALGLNNEMVLAKRSIKQKEALKPQKRIRILEESGLLGWLKSLPPGSKAVSLEFPQEPQKPQSPQELLPKKPKDYLQ